MKLFSHKKICLSCGRGYYLKTRHVTPSAGFAFNMAYDPALYCSPQCQKEHEWKKENLIELPLNDKKQEKKDFGIESSWLLEQARKPGGCVCPLCKKHAQVYAYSISGQMAKALLMIYRHFHKYPNSKPIHVDSYLSIFGKERPKGNKHGLLTFWGLLEKCEPGRQGEGYYRITKEGTDFVRGFTRVSKYAFIYNGKCFDIIGDQVAFVDCIKEKFDLNEFLMRDIKEL